MGEEWPQAAGGPQPFCPPWDGPSLSWGQPAHAHSPTCRDRGLGPHAASLPRPLGLSPGPQVSSITSSSGWTAPLLGTWATWAEGVPA